MIFIYYRFKIKVNSNSHNTSAFGSVGFLSGCNYFAGIRIKKEIINKIYYEILNENGWQSIADNCKIPKSVSYNCLCSDKPI